MIDAVIDIATAADHFRARLAASPMNGEPMPHVVVDEVVPAATFDLAVRLIPPLDYFLPASKKDRPEPKRDWYPGHDPGPTESTEIWNLLNHDWLTAVMPDIVRAFEQPLRAHCTALFGAAHADRALHGLSARTGRLMMRSPGYALSPHRDPLPGFITFLWHLHQVGGSEVYGTQFYAVHPDANAPQLRTYYPPPDNCRLVADVAYVPNRAIIFMNTAGGAHGAAVPRSAPSATERYSYQVYLGVHKKVLPELVAALPPEEQARWDKTNRS